MKEEKSLKQDWSKLSKDGIRDFWLYYSSQVDFRNPVQTYGYVKGIQDNLKEMTATNIEVKREEAIFTRARIHNSKRTLFPSISDLKYPPKEFTNLGRANLPGKPLFYCSNDPGTTIYEVRPKVGDWITTFEIEITKDNLDLLILGADTLENEAFTNMTDLHLAINEFLEIKFREEVPQNKNHLYFQTAYFVNAYIDNKDGVMYPSVGSNCKGWNVVFKPEFFDRYAYFRKATVHEVIEIKNDYEIFIVCHYMAEKYNQYGDLYWERIHCEEGHIIDEHIYKK